MNPTMKGLLIAFFSSVLMSPMFCQLYPQDLREETPPDDVRDFFRLLLLSKYGAGAPDYTDLEEESALVEPYFYTADAEKNLPFRQAVQNYVDWKKENQPYQEDQIIPEDQSSHDSQHIRKNQKSNNEDNSNSENAPTEENTTKESSSTTSGPDLLASMPPVTPNKGQKEYVMLRPPVDNHRKIEHWMQSMANGIFGMDHHLIQKRGSVLPKPKSK